MFSNAENEITESYKLIIYGEPRTKKNSLRPIINRNTGKPMIIPSDAYRAYEKEAVIVGGRPRQPIDFPVNVQMVFLMSTKRRVDLSNLEGGCLDLLVKRGVLVDDNCDIVVSQDGSRVIRGVGKNDSRVEVTITHRRCEE